MAEQEIRADYDRETIVVYQAYGPQIAVPAVAAQRFVPPFSLGRMTWIKPSFRWLMHRSNWGRKPGQEYTLAVRITRKGWEEALGNAVLTSPDRRVYRDSAAWREEFKRALVHVQWDPEYSIRGAKLDHRSIQVGLGRNIVERYVDEWTLEIRDLTPIVNKISGLLKAGQEDRAKRLLPAEKTYPLDPAIARRIGV
jgi:DNA-binding PadR family transcriptional regulator